MTSMVAVNYVAELAKTRVLGALLDALQRTWGGYDLLHHHQQGEFHHDVFVRVRLSEDKPRLPGEYLVISTNCNGGVKEVLCFEELAEPPRSGTADARQMTLSTACCRRFWRTPAPSIGSTRVSC